MNPLLFVRMPTQGHEDLKQDERVMQLFGLVFGYLSIARLNISYNRYWEGATELHVLHSKWADAASQTLAFDRIDDAREDISDDFCMHIVRLFSQFSAVATAMLHLTPAEQKARLTRAVKDFNDLEPFVKKGYWLEVQSGMRRKMGYARYDIENLSGKQPVDLVQKFEALDLACRAKDFDGAAAAYADAKEALASAVNGLA